MAGMQDASGEMVIGGLFGLFILGCLIGLCCYCIIRCQQEERQQQYVGYGGQINQPVVYALPPGAYGQQFQQYPQYAQPGQQYAQPPPQYTPSNSQVPRVASQPVGPPLAPPPVSPPVSPPVPPPVSPPVPPPVPAPAPNPLPKYQNFH